MLLLNVVIFIIVLLGLYLILRVTFYDEQVYVPHQLWNSEKFQSGDLILSFGDYLHQVHPGHLSLVVRDPEHYNQLYIWDLDSSETTNELKPLYPYLHSLKRVHVLHIKDPIPDLHIRLRKYSQSKYEYHGLIYYFNKLMYTLYGLPGVPIKRFQPTHKTHYYCSEVILRVLLDCGMCPLEYSELFYPRTLLKANHILSQWYHPIYCLNKASNVLLHVSVKRRLGLLFFFTRDAVILIG